jgi:hypothetical protein
VTTTTHPPADDEAFRAEVRQFLAEALTPEMRLAGRRTSGIFTDAPEARPWFAALARRMGRHRLDAAPARHLRQRIDGGRRAGQCAAGPAHGGAGAVRLRHR